MPIVKGTENKKLQKINNDNYALIKMLAENGVTKVAIKKALGLSPSTIYRVLASKDIADYRGMVNEQSDEKRAKKTVVEAKPVNEMLKEAYERKPTIDFSEADIQIVIEVLNKILETVTTIADNTDRGRGLFHR